MFQFQLGGSPWVASRPCPDPPTLEASAEDPLAHCVNCPISWPKLKAVGSQRQPCFQQYHKLRTARSPSDFFSKSGCGTAGSHLSDLLKTSRFLSSRRPSARGRLIEPWRWGWRILSKTLGSASPVSSAGVSSMGSQLHWPQGRKLLLLNLDLSCALKVINMQASHAFDLVQNAHPMLAKS